MSLNNLYGDLNLMGNGTEVTNLITVGHEVLNIDAQELQINGVTVVPTPNTDGYEVVTQVPVKQLSDFPTPISGIIRLVSNTNYFVQGTVDIGTNIIDFFGTNCSIRGVEKRITILKGTTAQSLIRTTADTSFTITDITLTQEGAGDILEVAIAGASRCALRDVILTGGRLVGKEGGVIQLTDSQITGSGYAHVGQGMNILNFGNTSIVAFSGETCLDFESGSEAVTITIINCFLIPLVGATALRAVTPDLLLNSLLGKCTFTGGGLLYDGMSSASNTWRMSGNIDIPNSNTGASLSLNVTGPPKVIVITSNNVYTDVSGTDILWADTTLEKFTLTNTVNGLLTYMGDRDIVIKFGGYLTIERGAGAIDVEVGIAVNGTVIACSEVTVPLDLNNRPVTATLPICTFNISTGDTIKIQIKNITPASTDNIDVSFGSLVLFE
jgi:hypothetical protein